MEAAAREFEAPRGGHHVGAELLVLSSLDAIRSAANRKNKQEQMSGLDTCITSAARLHVRVGNREGL